MPLRRPCRAAAAVTLRGRAHPRPAAVPWQPRRRANRCSARTRPGSPLLSAGIAHGPASTKPSPALRRVVRGDVRAASSSRPSTSSPTWPVAARPRARRRHRSDRAAAQPRGVPRPRDRPVAGDGRAGCGRSPAADHRRDDRRLRHDHGRRDVPARLPRLQHDHEPDDAGRAGRVLPQRRRAPRARRLLRDRGRGPGAAAAPAGRDRACLHRDPDAASASTSTTSPRRRWSRTTTGSSTVGSRPSRCRSATCGRPSST